MQESPSAYGARKLVRRDRAALHARNEDSRKHIWHETREEDGKGLPSAVRDHLLFVCVYCLSLVGMSMAINHPAYKHRSFFFLAIEHCGQTVVLRHTVEASANLQHPPDRTRT